MKNNVRSYTDEQLLERVSEHAIGFVDFPKNYWTIGVRSNEDAFNKFDDKFYLFRSTNFVQVFQGTTNTGAKGLMDFEAYNPNGAAVLQSNRIVYDSHKRGISKGREVYRQAKPFPYFRDSDKDNYAEEIGKLYTDKIIYAHIHDVKMGNVDAYKEYIGGWSVACQVLNNGAEWHQYFHVHTKHQQEMTLCILKEWEA